jgi:hypothetical protein
MSGLKKSAPVWMIYYAPVIVKHRNSGMPIVQKIKTHPSLE